MIQRPTVSFGSRERRLIRLVVLERLGRAPQVEVEQHAQVVVRERVIGIRLERAAIGRFGLRELAVLAQQDAELRIRGGVAGIDLERALERGARIVAALVVRDRRARDSRAGPGYSGCSSVSCSSSSSASSQFFARIAASARA